METYIIKDWTVSEVVAKGCGPQAVRYRVYRQGGKLFLDIHSPQGEPLHTLELPEGMVLEENSYEVLLRYALTDVIAA